MATSARSGTSATSSVNRLLGYVLGIVFLLVGALGFAVTNGVGFAEQDGNTLLGFEVNPLHNLVHLAIGVAGLALARSLALARTYGWVLAVAYGVTVALNASCWAAAGRWCRCRRSGRCWRARADPG